MMTGCLPLRPTGMHTFAPHSLHLTKYMSCCVVGNLCMLTYLILTVAFEFKLLLFTLYRWLRGTEGLSNLLKASWAVKVELGLCNCQERTFITTFHCPESLLHTGPGLRFCFPALGHSYNWLATVSVLTSFHGCYSFGHLDFIVKNPKLSNINSLGGKFL